jgi:hypothetical protein
MSIDDTPLDDDDTLISGEPGDTDDGLISEVENDGLDIDIVDEFNEDDFDEDFDDDFEEEIVGEYDLADDQYGKEFDNTFGHLTDPTREKPAPAPPAKDSDQVKKPGIKAVVEAKAKAKADAGKKTTKKPARKK